MAGNGSDIGFSVMHSKAAGIDIGSRSHWVSIGLETGQTREYGVFTSDLLDMCDWLKSEGITSVAMESTGFYWKQLFVLLQSYGLEVYLVNASYTKNVRGRKPSDLADSQWIWKMHSVGLLPASFQPNTFTEELRTYSRHRKRLIEGAAQCVNKMRKSLTLMNIQLSVVVSDITGKSGQAIIQAILDGQRDSKKLASLANSRLKTDRRTLEKALVGFWRADHLFELKQHWETYHHYRRQLTSCDEAIEKLLSGQVKATGQHDLDCQMVKKNGDRKMTLPSK